MNDIVKNIDGIATVTSFQISETFNKKHKHVLDNIRKLVKALTAENSAVKNYFIESSFINNRNREYEMYEMTRDGFSLLCMGFTGPKALKFKTDYIKAFNAMEKELKKIYAAREIGIHSRRVLTDEIKDSGENERMKGHGFSTYTKLAYKLAGIKYIKPEKGTKFRDTLLSDDLSRVENIEKMMETMIKAGNTYLKIKDDMNSIFTPKIPG